MDERRIEADARALERLPVAGQALAAGEIIGVAGDEPDAAMAERDQVSRHVVGCLHVVDVNRRCRGQIGARLDANDRDLAAEQFGERGADVGHRRGHDDAVELRLVDQRADVVDEAGRVDVARLDDHAEIGLAAPLPDPRLHVEDIIGAGIVVDQPDLERAPSRPAYARRGSDDS